MSPEPIDARTLPHNLDAERAVLGAILLNNGIFADASRVLRPADFYRDAHRRIFAAMVECLDRPGGALDFVLLREALMRRGDLEDVGGPMYLQGLVDGVPRSTNVRHYAGIVAEKAKARAAIFALQRGMHDVFEAEAAIDEVLRAVDSALLALRRTDSGEAKDLASRTPALLADLEWRVANRGKLIGLDTGFPSINEMTFGWQRQNMIVFGARPSVGKTALLGNALLTAAAYPLPEGETGKRVALMHSMEMHARQIEIRLLSALSRIASQRILGGALGERDWPLLSHAIEVMHGLKIVIDDAPARTAAQVRDRCREVIAEHGRLDMVAVDYVQMMTGTLQRKTATRTDELGAISRELKGIAKELDVPMFVLSQLKRTGGSRPKLEDLRESGNLEQDADIVLLLHRKNLEDPSTEAIIAKHRNGPTGTRMLHFEAAISLFEDRGQPAPDAATVEAEEAQTERKTVKAFHARRRRTRGVIDD